MEDDDDTAELGPGRAEESRIAAEFVRDLLSSPDEETLLSRLREIARVGTWEAAQAFLVEARSYARLDPQRASTLARYAILAAEEIAPALHPATLRASLLASAYCRLAEIHRLAGCLEEAESAFRSSASYLAVAGIAGEDLEVRVLYLSLLARLRADQGSLEEAEDLRLQADVLREHLQ
jgi:hypothetical protein